MRRRILVSGVSVVVLAVLAVLAVIRQPARTANQRPGAAVLNCVTGSNASDVAATGVAPHVSSYAPPRVFSPGLSNVVDRRLPFDERVHALAGGEVQEITDVRDLGALAQLLCDPMEDDTVRHEIANLLFRSGFVQLEACLVKVIENPTEEERFRSWAVQHLGNLLLAERYAGDRPALADRLRSLLRDRHIKVRREAMLALARHNDSALLAKVREVLFDTGPDSEAMRDLAIRCAREKDMRDAMPAIRAHAMSTNEIVRIAALTTLSQWGDEESRPAFQDAVASKSVRLQRCGSAALARLNGARAKE